MKQIEDRETDSTVVKAFVVFKTIHFKELAEQEYSFANCRLSRCCQTERLRFQGHKIQVKQAPEPSELYWENLDFPGKRFIRREVVMLITMILLILCLVALVYLKASSLWLCCRRSWCPSSPIS